MNKSVKREKCWLSKKVTSAILSTYFIENSDEITSTVMAEMTELFPDCMQAAEQGAAIVFRQSEDALLGEEGFKISETDSGFEIMGTTSKALLYGLYHFYRIQIENSTQVYPVTSVPDQSIRMINHWDNVDGSVERGYAGDSIFYKDNQFRKDYKLIHQYGRLLASTSLNAVSINNVNVHKLETRFLLEENLVEIKRITDIFAKYGIKLFLSINYASPIFLGGLSTADPLDQDVIAWWKSTIDKLYQIIPNFGGFVVKADSEGEPGPFTYGRNHDEGANMLARILKVHGGLLIWRCFVYNCKQDWRDRSIDRAKAAYDNFVQLDGNFEDTVILQIKNGPIDFQIREPVSPLFGALQKTNQILEFQITQEYTGQQKHICYLVPMWKETLDFDTKYPVKQSGVGDILKSQSPVKKHSGVAAVSNVGMDSNWAGHTLAQVNLYGYGRLTWDNSLTSEQIADEWMSLTFDLSDENKNKLKHILLTSRETFEYYTAPLGIGFMVRPNVHYGPDVDGYEYDRWGTYHFADRNGIGVDRSVATGTKYTRQYADERYLEYENPAACPDELVLFFHHIPYKHQLHNGKTLIQHIYDTHFEGVERVEAYIRLWKSLKSEMDDEVFENVMERLQEQYRSAQEWRDQINTYFYRKSGITDEHNRKIYS